MFEALSEYNYFKTFNCFCAIFIFSRTLFPKPVREKLANELLIAAAIEPTTRPFQLTVTEFGRICEGYMSICKDTPDYMKYNYRDPNSKYLDYWPDVEINNSASCENIISLKDL